MAYVSLKIYASASSRHAAQNYKSVSTRHHTRKEVIDMIIDFLDEQIDLSEEYEFRNEGEDDRG